MQTFPDLDLINVIYEKALLLKGETEAAQIAVELVRQKPDLNGRVPPAWLETQQYESGVESRYRYDSFYYRPPAAEKRYVPLPQLPLQIPSLLLALPGLQQMANLYAE